MAQAPENSNIRVVPIASEETYPIRSLVLREGKPFSHCVFEGDTEPDTFHLGAYLARDLIGICSIMRRPSPLLPDVQPAFQLRGMAVLPGNRSLGIGALLLQTAEQYLRENQVFLLWMNARLNAVPFYERYDYEKKGTMFEIEGIGPHFYMDKILSDETQDIR